jgi:hypothetical protein
MRDQIPRIAGIALLVCALLLLVFSPDHFSIGHFFLFLAFFVCGIFLVTEILGTHPVAARLRREASRAGMPRRGPLCYVPEQVFPYAGSRLNRFLATALCAAIGLSLIALGFILLRFLPAGDSDRFLAGIPPWITGILCIWISIRYPSRCLRVTPQSITVKGYFRTSTMHWDRILALIAREHYTLLAGGFVSTGVLYSLYSDHNRLWFTSHLPGSERLASLVAEATGLTWNSI